MILRDLKLSVFKICFATLFAASILLASCSGGDDFEPNPAAETAPKVSLTISVIADSLNHLSAKYQVAQNTNARDFLKRVFQMDFVDAQERFVTGIAGWKTDSEKREFWSLEVDGASSQVGISEVVIEDDMEIVWRLKAY